jgi:hypothetical protein
MPVSVTVTVGSVSKTFSEPENENPLRGLEMAREWLREQHIALAKEPNTETTAAIPKSSLKKRQDR